MNLMEKVPNNKKIRRRKKKKFTKSDNNEKKTIIKPECFDGMTNWLNLQKTIESKKEEFKNLKRKIKRKDSNRSFKIRRISFSKEGMPITPEKQKSSSYHSTKDKDDSGCVSGSDLSPEPSERKARRSYEVEDENINPEDLNVLTPALSLDCEMVGTGSDGKESMLARVSIVNEYSTCVYDAYVKPKEKITDFRTAISGIRPSDLKKAKDLFEVQKEVAALLDGRLVVGHALKHDFNVLFLSHPRSLIRDTSKYKPFRDLFGGKTPSLKKLTLAVLGVNIQDGEHNPVEDAQAAMMLYLRNKRKWNKEFNRANRRRKQPDKTEE